MILHKKNIYCKDIENKLKSYHNKTNWVNFVWMQDFWMLLKSDSISWQKILHNSHNLQNQWPVVSTLSQEMKVYLNQKGWIRGNTKIGPVLEVTTCCLQGKYGVQIRIGLWTRTILTRGSAFLMAWISGSQTWTTMSRKPQKCCSMTMRWKGMHVLLRADRRLKQTTETYFCQLIHKNYIFWWKNLDRYWTTRLFAHRLFRVEETDQSSSSWKSTSKKRERLNSGDYRLPSEPFCAFSTLVWWKVEEHHGKRRRKQENISILYRFFRRNSLPSSSSRSFRTQSHWSFMTGQCIDSGRFLQVHLSRWMCNQFTFHHQFRIDTGRSKFEQKTDSILSACGSNGWSTQRSWDDRLGSTASCTVHTYSMEEKSQHGVLGRHQTCSKERIKSSIRRDRTPSFFTIHSQPVVSRKLLWWKLEKSYTKK